MDCTSLSTHRRISGYNRGAQNKVSPKWFSNVNILGILLFFFVVVIKLNFRRRKIYLKTLYPAILNCKQSTMDAFLQFTPTLQEILLKFPAEENIVNLAQTP